MEDTNETLRHEVFVSGTAEGLSRSLGVLKTAAEKYINEHDLTANVVNLSESDQIKGTGLSVWSLKNLNKT